LLISFNSIKILGNAFAKHFTEISKICGHEGVLINQTTLKKLKDFKQTTMDWARKQPTPDELEKYSHILSSYQSSNSDQVIFFVIYIYLYYFCTEFSFSFSFSFFLISKLKYLENMVGEILHVQILQVLVPTFLLCPH